MAGFHYEKELFTFFCVCFVSVVCGAFDLTILHTNDVHARVQAMNAYGGQCTSETCYGGAARMKTKVQEIRNQFPNTLLLDAGDQFQGTLWFYHYGGNITYTMMNELKYDCMALGNHEFDLGISGIRSFLENVHSPTLSANIDASNEPSISPRISKRTIVQVGGQQIGIVGYTTKDTPMISTPGALIFHDEVSSVRREVQSLTTSGINKIIALGHAGFEVDKKIAEIDDVDIVIGGHSNTFLYTGTPPSNEKPVGEYPHIVHKPVGGGQTLVVQDYAFGKYLGFLQVKFDENGVVTEYGGNPILLNNSIPEDADLKSKIDVLYSAIEKSIKEPVGRTLVTLSHTSCRLMECNLGNAIADAYVYHNLKDADDINGTKVFISLVNAGSIRATFNKGRILLGQIHEAQPFSNTLETIVLQGRYLRQALEHSAASYNVDEPDGAFLQVSGLRIKYNMQKPVNQRVVEVKALCAECDIPEYKLLDDDKMYRIILSNFVLLGGDGYSVIKDHAQQDHIVGNLDADTVASYVKDMSPLYTALENRIQLVDSSNPCGTSAGVPLKNHFYLTFIILSITHILSSFW